jgi:hypothetical protein
MACHINGVSYVYVCRPKSCEEVYEKEKRTDHPYRLKIAFEIKIEIYE